MWCSCLAYSGLLSGTVGVEEGLGRVIAGHGGAVNHINCSSIARLVDCAAVAQLAERRPGKAEVPGSNPGGGSTLHL